MYNSYTVDVRNGRKFAYMTCRAQTGVGREENSIPVNPGREEEIMQMWEVNGHYTRLARRHNPGSK